MKIILLQEMRNLGKKGDIKEVAEGYAQNFLIPKKLVEIATQNAVRKIEMEQEKERQKKEQTHQAAEDLAIKLKKVRLVIAVKEKNDKLFGSVNSKMISAELAKVGLDISPDCIIIKQIIRKTGRHEIRVRLAEGKEVKIVMEVQGGA
jgi:large subunit ribosomal protein L9